MKPSTPDICPVCGAAVPRAALACPECGADENAGWNEAGAVYDGLDLPDEDFKYDAYVRREFGDAAPPAPRAARIWPWLLIAAVVLGTLALGFLLRR